MSTLLTNVNIIMTNLISWLGSVATELIGNEIFQIMLAVIIFLLIYSLIRKLISEIQARKLAIALTGSTQELEYYRSLSDEEKEEYDKNFL